MGQTHDVDHCLCRRATSHHWHVMDVAIHGGRVQEGNCPREPWICPYDQHLWFSRRTGTSSSDPLLRRLQLPDD